MRTRRPKGKKGEDDSSGNDEDEKKPEIEVLIDFDGIERRTLALPMPTETYSAPPSPAPKAAFSSARTTRTAPG